MGFSIGKIGLGSPAHKRYNHNLSFDNNTTFDFGSVQPLMCQYMMPNSDIKASYKQLVRLSPLVAPSFARVHLQNEVSFIPMPEIVPYFEAMQSRMSYSVGLKTYKPEKLPTTTNAWLVFQLLVRNGCQYSYWQPSSGDTLTSSKYTSFQVTSANVKDVQLSLFLPLAVVLSPQVLLTLTSCLSSLLAAVFTHLTFQMISRTMLPLKVQTTLYISLISLLSLSA